jgi:coenzyme F420-reducing hydrogenase alpha subunit
MADDRPPMGERRTIEVKALARVEGEGALRVKLDGEKVEHVELSIYEPPRFFEAFLRGREVGEVPDLVARICGICPVAYQMTACHALEKALGLDPGPVVRRLRRLLYCGEWVESHALHIFLLHAPDFLGFESGLSLARENRGLVERGLRLKKVGNEVIEAVGGRAVHPVNVAVGGFYRAPGRVALRALLPDLEWALGAAVETVREVAAFEFPDFEADYEFVALRHPDEYPMNDGRVVSGAGLDVAVEDYEDHFAERQVAHSHALHSVRLPGESSYLVGPLARVNLHLDRLSPTARREAGSCGVAWPCRNNFKSIVARALELVHACEESIAIIEGYDEEPSPPRGELTLHPCDGCHATEAPRGLLYHRFEVGDNGLVSSAKIIPPTSQNQLRIEDDLRAFLPRVLPLGDAAAGRCCEHLIRNYDPCISCATHFLRFRVDR